MKRIFFFPVLLFFVGVTVFCSCRKGVLVSSKIHPGGIQGNSNVYVTVNQDSVTSYYYNEGKYYKNGTPVTIPQCASISSITTSGNDVYVVGYADEPYFYAPAYWKNGTEVAIPNFTNHTIVPGPLVVSGTDVYIPVTEYDYNPSVDEWSYAVATYWKNNTQVRLSDSLSLNEVGSMAVSEKGIYVVGSEIRYTTYCRGKYWLNGTPVYLPGDGIENAFARSIVISGNDVYIGGIIYHTDPVRHGGIPRIVYWKNGTLVYVTDGTRADLPYSMAVSGTDVYIAGVDVQQLSPNSGLSKWTAMYWKNGSPVVLSTSPYNSCANAIAVDGQDVYVAGYECEGIRKIAKYWKNGIPAFASDAPTSSEASSICVSK
jgi:hypothetical protein